MRGAVPLLAVLAWSVALPLRADDKSLRCTVDPIRPLVNYGLRFQAGYAVHVPLEQYAGPDHAWHIALEVEPIGAKPTRFTDEVTLPPVPGNSAIGEYVGQFTLGEGSYSATFSLTDDQERVCRKQWSVEAKRPRSLAKAVFSMAPNAVSNYNHLPQPIAETRRSPIRRISVLLDAAVPRGRRGARVTLSPATQGLLVGSLLSLWNSQPDTDFRATAFNLDQRQELFRRDNLDETVFSDFVNSLGDLKLAQVDLKTLQDPNGHLRFLAQLINRELRATPPPDAIVFLGPQERFGERIDPELIDPMPRNPPRFFYLRYQVSPRFPPEELDPEAAGRESNRRLRPLFYPVPRNLPDPFDTVAFAMERLGGTTITFHNPEELAGALEKLKRALGLSASAR